MERRTVPDRRPAAIAKLLGLSRPASSSTSCMPAAVSVAAPIRIGLPAGGSSDREGCRSQRAGQDGVDARSRYARGLLSADVRAHAEGGTRPGRASSLPGNTASSASPSAGTAFGGSGIDNSSVEGARQRCRMKFRTCRWNCTRPTGCAGSMVAFGGFDPHGVLDGVFHRRDRSRHEAGSLRSASCVAVRQAQGHQAVLELVATSRAGPATRQR